MTTVNSDMVIYNDLAQTAYLEERMDKDNIFNAESRGAIVFRAEAIEGDFRQRAFYQIGGEITHRNVNSTAAVTPVSIDADEMVGPKVPWKYGPRATTEEAFKRRLRSLDEFADLCGRDMAGAVLRGQATSALVSLQGAIGSNTDMVVSGVSLAVEGKKILTAGLRTMGDKFNQIAIWVMPSDIYMDIVDQAIDEKVYEEAGLVIYGGAPGTMGKPVLVTDVCQAGYIFGLQAGAVQLIESQTPGVRLYDLDGQENLAIGFRGEGVFNVEVLGYSWDRTVGGANPDATDLVDTDNWDKYATDNKATAGFIIDLSTAGS